MATIKTKPYKDITLEFEEERHRFTIAGRNIISVTGATGMIDKSGPLMGWQEKLTREDLMADVGKILTAEIILRATTIHRKKKLEAADTGTLIHKWINLYIEGKKPKIPDDEKVKNGVLAFMKWIDENKIKFLKSEEYIYSKKHDYAGILDIEAKINSKLAIIDIKSSSGVYNEMRYQVAGYRGAKEEMTGKEYDESWIIQLGKETGEFNTYLIDEAGKQHKKDFKVFLGALEIKRRELELKIK